MATPRRVVADDESSRRRAIMLEAQAIERAAGVWSILYRYECRWWRRLNTLLVTLAALLATASGGTGLSEVVDRRVAATIALAAAAVAAVSWAIGGGTRAAGAEAAATADMALADAARAFHLTAAPYVELDQAIAGFEALCKQRDQVVAAMPITHVPIRRRKWLWEQAKIDQARRLSEVMAARGEGQVPFPDETAGIQHPVIADGE